MKTLIIFVSLTICFAFSKQYINATGFEDFLPLRSKSLALNEGGFVFDIMQREKIREERKLRESKLNPLLVSKGNKIKRGIVVKCYNCGKEKYIKPFLTKLYILTLKKSPKKTELNYEIS